MSGYTEAFIDDERMVESRASFIMKPFTPLALTRKVREALDTQAATAAPPH